jgi:rare lipoprotein A
MNRLAWACIIVAAALALVAMQPGPAVSAERCGLTASYYGKAHHGRTQANGQPFNMHAMTAAMWGVPFGARYRVTHKGKSVVVKVTDRGPAKHLGRAIDLSQAAFAKLAPLRRGLIPVCIERLK